MEFINFVLDEPNLQPVPKPGAAGVWTERFATVQNVQSFAVHLQSERRMLAKPDRVHKGLAHDGIKVKTLLSKMSAIGDLYEAEAIANGYGNRTDDPVPDYREAKSHQKFVKLLLKKVNTQQVAGKTEKSVGDVGEPLTRCCR